MEQVRLICTPFLMIAILFCLYGLLYTRRWQRKNPWYTQNDAEMRLSPQERAYRQNERRKYNNVPLIVFGALFACLIPMVLLLQKAANDGWHPATDWFYLIPLLAALFLAVSGIRRK